MWCNYNEREEYFGGSGNGPRFLFLAEWLTISLAVALRMNGTQILEIVTA